MPQNGDYYDDPIKAYGALWRKGEASHSGGAYRRGARIAPADVSRYSRWANTDHGATLSMAMVDAILHVLSGGVQEITCDTDGAAGRVSIASGSQPGLVYRMSWDDRGPSRDFGGFINGPTYQVAIVAIVMLLSEARGGRLTDTEFVERWWELTRIPGALPTSATGAAALCQSPGFRQALERVADSLALAMLFRLPNNEAEIPAFVHYNMTLSGMDGSAISLPASSLLQPPAVGRGMSGMPDLAGVFDDAPRRADEDASEDDEPIPSGPRRTVAPDLLFPYDAPVRRLNGRPFENTVGRANRSRYAAISPGSVARRGPLSGALVDGILAVLEGDVVAVESSPDGRRGTLAFALRPSGERLRAAWDDTGADTVIHGLDADQADLIGATLLVMRLCEQRTADDGDREVLERWEALFRGNPSETRAISQARQAGNRLSAYAGSSSRQTDRAALEALGDALQWATRRDAEQRVVLLPNNGSDLPCWTNLRPVAIDRLYASVQGRSRELWTSAAQADAFATYTAPGSIPTPAARATPTATDVTSMPTPARRATPGDVTALPMSPTIPLSGGTPSTPPRQVAVAPIYHRTPAEAVASLRAARHEMAAHAESGAVRIVLAVQDGIFVDNAAVRAEVDALRADGCLVVGLSLDAGDAAGVIEAFGARWSAPVA